MSTFPCSRGSGARSSQSPPPTYVEVDHDQELGEIREIVARGLAFVAEREGRRLRARPTDRPEPRPPDRPLRRPRGPPRRDRSRPRRGRRGALHAQGIEHLDLEVRTWNSGARTVYSGGVSRTAPRARRATRDATRAPGPGHEAESFASLHVQTDAIADVERAAREFAPRIGSVPSGRRPAERLGDRLRRGDRRRPHRARAVRARAVLAARGSRRALSLELDKVVGSSRWSGEASSTSTSPSPSSTADSRLATSSGSPRTPPCSPGSPGPTRRWSRRSHDGHVAGRAAAGARAARVPRECWARGRRPRLRAARREAS